MHDNELNILLSFLDKKYTYLHTCIPSSSSRLARTKDFTYQLTPVRTRACPHHGVN